MTPRIVLLIDLEGDAEPRESAQVGSALSYAPDRTASGCVCELCVCVCFRVVSFFVKPRSYLALTYGMSQSELCDFGHSWS